MSRPSPSGSKPEKTMSSRLLTMKFMQRAAATAATKEASQPSSAAGSPNPITKRQRLSTDGLQSPSATPSSDLEAISAALAAEEEKRREALARQAADAGESEWVLDYSGVTDTDGEYATEPLVIAAESLDADDDDLVNGGRQAYGNFKRKNKTVQHTSTNDGEAEDLDQIDSMIKKAKDAARQKPVRLSQLTSISGGRQSLGGDKSQKKRKHK